MVEIEESDQEVVEIEESDPGVIQTGSSTSRAPHPIPEGIRGVIEKTALFVLRVSEGQRPNYIRQIRREQDPQKFGFLLPENEYHWYFLECLNIGSAKELTAETEASHSTRKPVPEPASASSTPAPKRSTGGFVPEPPVEIRGFIESIAQSAAEHGDDWQWEVYRKQDRTAYSFLHPGHEYHRFFLQQKERALANTGQATYLPTEAPETTDAEAERPLVGIDWHQTLERDNEVSPEIANAVKALQRVADVHIFSFVGSDTRLRDTRDKIAASPVADLEVHFSRRKSWQFSAVTRKGVDTRTKAQQFLDSGGLCLIDDQETILSELKGRWEQAGLQQKLRRGVFL